MVDNAFRSSAEGSVLAVLFAQHDRVRELLAEVRGAEGEYRWEVFEALRALLAAHETAEETVLRPVSVQIMSRDLTAARNREEREIVKLLAGLDGIDAADGQFGERFVPFEHAVVEHVSMEEAEEFPVIEDRLDPHESAVMARWIQRAVVLGPTRPHPAAVGSPAAQRVVAPFAALLDHARDLFDGSRDNQGAVTDVGDRDA
jgi:hypothetical protein